MVYRSLPRKAKLSSPGGLRWAKGFLGCGVGQFRSPQGVAADPSGPRGVTQTGPAHGKSTRVMLPASVTLEQRPSTSLAVVRRQVRPSDLSRAVPDGCGAVWAELRSQGLRGGRNVAIYWDDVIHLEAGVEVSDPFAERGGVVRSTTPAGLVVALKHFGPYGTLSAAHQALMDWCHSNQHRCVGPRWEIYGHWQHAWDTKPSGIETEVAYLVMPI